MLMMIAPATTMDFEQQVPDVAQTLPRFLDEAAELMAILKRYDVAALQDVLGVSEALAVENYERFQGWTADCHQTPLAKPAIFAFRGATYQGLDADSLTAGQLAYAQRHLRIMTGLYGVLRPFDHILPYRLELKTKLPTAVGDSLYHFWGDRLTAALNEALAASGSEVLVNLASNEYVRAVDKRQLNGRLLDIGFKEKKGDKYRTISFFAKEARGRMSRFIIENEVTTVAALRGFDWDGYGLNEALSKKNLLVFTR